MADAANRRRVRAIGARPVERFETDYQAMVALPPIAPQVGLGNRIRLRRAYYSAATWSLTVHNVD